MPTSAALRIPPSLPSLTGPQNAQEGSTSSGRKAKVGKITPLRRVTSKSGNSTKPSRKAKSSSTAARKQAKKGSATKAATTKQVATKATAGRAATKKTSIRTAAATKAVAKKNTFTAKVVAKKAAKTTRSNKNNKIQEEPVGRRPLTMDDDLESLWVIYKRCGDQNLRNILIELHMPLVRVIAERLLQTLPKSIDLDDLSSAGTFGLMDAINGYDLSRGIKFKTYCTTRIRGSILDELRSQDWVPRLVRLKAHRLEKALRSLEGELGRDPNQFELAEAMDMSLMELRATKSEANAKTIFSLSEKWDDSDDDNEMEKVEILADKKCQDPVQTMHQRDVLELITSNLTKKERLIIIMYYYEGLTMREIGEIMELTESRVCQIHSNVMSRLKGQLDRVHLQVN
jgi:RNA polymerase sigma factor for flagellar operon FliA